MNNTEIQRLYMARLSKSTIGFAEFGGGPSVRSVGVATLNNWRCLGSTEISRQTGPELTEYRLRGPARLYALDTAVADQLADVT